MKEGGLPNSVCGCHMLPQAHKLVCTLEMHTRLEGNGQDPSQALWGRGGFSKNLSVTALLGDDFL